jgi:hypothetical protein
MRVDQFLPVRAAIRCGAIHRWRTGGRQSLAHPSEALHSPFASLSPGCSSLAAAVARVDAVSYELSYLGAPPTIEEVGMHPIRSWRILMVTREVSTLAVVQIIHDKEVELHDVHGVRGRASVEPAVSHMASVI